MKIMTEEENDKIKELKKRLYGKEFKEAPERIGEFEKKEYKIKEGWLPEEPPMSPRKKIKITKRHVSIKKILIASVVFFVIAMGLAFYVIQSGSNVFSLKNVDIEIDGPVSISGGEEFTLNINVTNRNETAMEFANLIIQYPEGAYESFDSQKELLRVRESLGRINPNETVEKTISLALFGSGDSKKEISFTLESRFEGSSATLDKIELYEVSLASSPVNLSVSIPEDIGVNQEFEIIINLKSNSNNTLNDLILKVEYPFGFTFSDASPSPAQGKNIWKIGDMPKADERVIKIRGVVDGQEDEERIFVVEVGSKHLKDEDAIGTVYNSVSEQTLITKPFLGLKVLVNGVETSEYISKSKESLRFDILWSSNSLVKITDGTIEAKLSGDIVDKFSVFADKGGFYKSLDGTIIWSDRTGKSELSIIEPGESGKVGFTLQSLPLVDKEGRVFKNPEITVSLNANGNQVTDTGESSRLSASASKKIKIESKLEIVPRAVYYSGPFNNTGPLPPKADEETTYTIILSVINTSNKISPTTVKTTLPTYMRWLGVVSPSSEDVSFNDVVGEIVWNIGTVDGGTGFVKGAREVAFQVGLTPSVSQRGRTPFLTGEITLSGKDTFTGTVLEDKKKGLNTNLSTDPSFSVSQASVKTR